MRRFGESGAASRAMAPEREIGGVRADGEEFPAEACRRAGQSPFLRELIVPFGRSGHVALFEIEDEKNVAVLAARHQIEDDYH